ncbi:MAG TPA: tetratricopeptide repeat protein [Pyrinomonadaceae bacterium]|nr:tetratricopeptide repeat protein [Pyrinomonadaceae bacterium]
MSLQILPVFISSTWIDLQPERAAVKDAVLRLKETQFVGMEHFGSRDETTRRASLDEVDRSSVYIGIIAARYGSGITEAEYRRARERGLHCLIYFKDDATVSDELRETDAEQTAKLDALKRELRANHIIGPAFVNPHDLAAKVTADLHRWLFDEYVTPLLQGGLRGEVERGEAQALLDAVKDLNALNRDLVAQLKSKGFNVASGDRSVAYTGDAKQVNIHTGDTNVYGGSAPIIPTLHQLRAPVGDFVGREKEIEGLLATLRGGTSAAISGISGMGGIGKTELAYYVAERLRDTYPDAQLVVDMRGTDDPPRDPSDALAACIRAFVGIEQQLPDDAEVLTQLYRSVLEGKRALILLDNASDGAQVLPLLPPAGSALLVTSRRAVTLPRMTRVMLDELQPTEARELLTGIAPRVAADIADRICYLCGYLPLAIRAAGSLLDVTFDLDADEYAAQLGDERTRLELIGKEGVEVGVEASFNLSYARLDADAARVFRGLAVFPVAFEGKAEEAVCEDEKHKHLSELVRRSLVLYNEETRRYRLHDLARLFADSRLSETEQSAGRMRHATQYLKVLEECDELYLQGGEAIKTGLARYDAELRNIEAGQKWACEQSGGDEAAAQLCNAYPNAGVYMLSLRQHPRENIFWLEAALAAARQLQDRAAEGRHLGNLGIAYAALGETRRAVEFHEQALIVLREIGDRRGEGSVLGNLGLAYADLGETRRAIEFYEQRLVVAREIGDRRGEANALGNLGNAYAALGETRRAIEFHEQALVIDREIGDRRGEGQDLGNLGNAYAALGETRRAIEFYEQRLVVAREIGDRRGEGNALGNLGLAYADLGETRRAVEFYEQHLVVAREIGDRRGEGNALFNTSLALDKLGDRAQAIAHGEAALEIYEQIESPYAERVRAKLAQWRGES